MALETATFISGLVSTNPTSSDNVGEGDNHLRLIKSTLLATFPAITGAVSVSHTQINTSVAATEAATNANTANAIVRRNASGNFSASTISSNLIGDVVGNVLGTLTGYVVGDVVGNAATASQWATARTISLGGDLTGSVSINGSANVTLTAEVVDDSHIHDTRYFTESESDARFLGISANAVSASKWAAARTITLGGHLSGSVAIDGSANATLTAAVLDDSHNHIISNVDGLQAALDSKLGATANAVSASKWATARTITLGGDLTGSVSIDGASNVTLTAVVVDDSHAHVISNIDGLQAALDGKLGSSANAVSASKWATARTLSLGGDLSGSVSIDGSANATLTATVSDDSHNHIISNVDGLQTALDGKLGVSANAVSASKWETARTLTLGGDVSGSVSLDGSANASVTVDVIDDSHNHIISNVDGLQTALDGKLATSGTAANSTKWGNYNISTASTGTDANTIYFRT